MILGEGFIGAQIAQWRTNLGLNIADAARQAGVPPSAWGRIENGKTPNPYMDTVIKIFHSLGAQIEVKMAPREPGRTQEQLHTDG